MTTTTCPHCGRVMRSQGAGRHIDRCHERPGVRDLVRRLLDVDATGHACPQRDYEKRATAHNAQPGFGVRAPSLRTLLGRFRNWDAVLEWTKLDGPIKAERVALPLDPILAEVAADKAAADAALEAERLGGYGLPVCSRRALPDGRVAWMVR